MSKDFIERPRKNEKDGAIQYVKQLLERAVQEHRNEDVNKLEEIISLLQTKKYGLVWEEHAEIVEEEMKRKIPVFVENTEKKIVGSSDEKEYNFLLEGDNLHSLKLLEKTHAGKIDVIYIDPPYNTGNKDFIYNDKFVDKTDGYTHSKWLSFMSKRLEIARKLLSEDGAIFINIDDNEHAQLKLLCDEIFGESNFLTSIPWHNRTSIQNDTDISVNHEYVVAYAKYKRPDNRRIKDSNKHIWNTLTGFTFNMREADKSKFSNPDNDPRGIWKADPFDAPNIRPNLTYPILNPNTGETHLPPKGRCWRMSKEKYDKALEDNRIIFGKGGNGRPQLKVFYSEVSYKGMVANTWFDADIFGTSTEGKKELLKCLPESNVIFSTPKPTKFYRELMKLSTSKESIILDFFAGSGTTGHAVVQLNQEDGGNRKYILCTNNENNICEEVTYKRLTNIQKELPHNIKYFKTDFVDKNEFPDVQLENELLNYIAPLVELEFGIDISNPSVQIILTEEHLAELIKEGKLEKDSTLFMHSEVFLDSTEEAVLSKLNISRQVIPDYYFGKELWS
jgi:hypothetical protein